MLLSGSKHLILFILLFFFLRKRGGGKEYQISMQEWSFSCHLHVSYKGLSPQPKHVPWLGIEPATFPWMGWHLTNWATAAKANTWFLCSIHNSLPSFPFSEICILISISISLKLFLQLFPFYFILPYSYNSSALVRIPDLSHLLLPSQTLLFKTELPPSLLSVGLVLIFLTLRLCLVSTFSCRKPSLML